MTLAIDFFTILISQGESFYSKCFDFSRTYSKNVERIFLEPKNVSGAITAR